MKGIVYALFTLLAMVAWCACTDQRDLYVDAKPMFIIKNDWSAARLTPESATAMLFPRPDPCEPMFSDPCRHKLYMEPNLYDILVFNEVMFSPDVTNLEGIVYRGTNQFNTFGAYAKPNPVNPIFKSGNDEVMVGYGYPEPLAARTVEQKEVLSGKEYVLKYQNGKNGFPICKDFDADSVALLPLRVTRDVKVIAHVKNLKSQFRVSGALRGFAEGVLLSSRQPDGANASYTFDLNSATPDPAVKDGHIIVSKSFATFGPWWNNYPANQSYILDIVAAKNVDIFRYSFDVTECNGVTVTQSIGEAIVKIRTEESQFRRDGTLPAMDEIIIEVWFELPPVIDDSIDVGVGDWGTDIIIPIPIG